jgi:hypothetical protein
MDKSILRVAKVSYAIHPVGGHSLNDLSGMAARKVILDF